MVESHRYWFGRSDGNVFRHHPPPEFPRGRPKTRKIEKVQKIGTWTDQPYNAASLAFLQSYYGDHPYGGNADGSIETVEAFTQKDLFEWHRKIFIPNNMVFIVTGDVVPDEMIKKFGAAFEKLKKGRLPKQSSRSKPAIQNDVISKRSMNVQGAYLLLGYPAPSISGKDVPVMDLINNMMSKRLHFELRDKRGLAYLIGSAYQSLVGPSCITAVINTAPEKYPAARDGIVNEFKRFCDEPISSSELGAAKKQCRGSYIMSQETGIDRGRTLGIFELQKRDYDYADAYLKAIEKVRPKDIKWVAKKYFDHYVLAVVAQEGSIKE